MNSAYTAQKTSIHVTPPLKRQLTVGTKIQTVIIQPTNFCNANCKYCYLSNKNNKRHMPTSVARSVAKGLSSLPHPVTLVWHSGEPLTIGIDKLRSLFSEFRSLVDAGMVNHAIQTNATLINSQWCNFFKASEVSVSISIDGPIWANANRVDKSGRNIFSEIMRGVDSLTKNSIPFNVICVVTEDTIGYPEKLFDFFVSLGCKSVAFNIAANDGVANIKQPSQEKAHRFWKSLFGYWKKMPVVDIREFRNVFSWLETSHFDIHSRPRQTSVDLTPTISTRGDVRILSPELADIKSEKYSNFIIGNVIKTDLPQLLKKVGREQYFIEFKEGKRMCFETCHYFSYCLGGNASNKISEKGDLKCTETNWCINSRMALIDAIIEELMEAQNGEN